MGDWVSQVGASLGLSDSAVTEELLLERRVTHIKMASDVCIRRLTREQQRCTEGGGETRTHNCKKPGRTPYQAGDKVWRRGQRNKRHRPGRLTRTWQVWGQESEAETGGPLGVQGCSFSDGTVRDGAGRAEVSEQRRKGESGGGGGGQAPSTIRRAPDEMGQR